MDIPLLDGLPPFPGCLVQDEENVAQTDRYQQLKRLHTALTDILGMTIVILVGATVTDAW